LYPTQARERKRELFLLFWRAKTFNQALYLLGATATAHGGKSFFFYLCHGCRTIGDGIDNISLKNLVTGTEIPVQILLKNWREFIQGIFDGSVFQSVRIITIKKTE